MEFTKKEETSLLKVFIKAYLVAADATVSEFSNLSRKVEISVDLLDDLMAALLTLDDFLPEDLKNNLMHRQQMSQRSKEGLAAMNIWQTIEDNRRLSDVS